MENLVILGNFDGVHLGHQYLIKKGVKYGKEKKLNIIVYTFNTLKKNKQYILSLKQREKKILELGVDKVIFADFESVKTLSPVEFVDNVLKKELNAKIVFCGYNYSFGFMKEGNPKILSKLIKTIIIDEYRLNNELVSSSKIRELIYLGDIENANRLLGQNIYYEGIVEKGKQLGRLIGFPTANISLSENRIKLANGVYGSITKIEDYDKEFLSITNIGFNPTIADNNKLNIETYIYDFNNDIYGKKISVSLIQKIRLEKKFNTVDELKEQIKKDSIEWKNEYVRYKDK